MSTSITIPVVVAAIALYPLTKSNAFDSFADIFFGLSSVEQVSILALLFATVFGAVALTSSTSNNSGARKQTPAHYKPSIYPLTQVAKLTTEKDQFKALYPLLREEILTSLEKEHELLPEALDRIGDMMDYTVPGGKLNRGTTVVSVHRTLKGRSSLTPHEICQASVLGWAIEFLQAFFLVADDVMDESQTRRGRPCWYKKDGVQLVAINDSFLLESFVFTILRQHFWNEPYYQDLVELFMMVIQKTEVGQMLDLTSQPMGQPADLNRFTPQRYQKIVKYKTSYYTFFLPVALGMLTSGVSGKKAFDTAERICCIMGEYFQIQDDYLDCYGDPAVKMGTDIQDNKCSWLVVQALRKATTEQRQILLQNYGKWDHKKVARVKELYTEMNLESMFKDYEEESYKEIQSELDRLTLMPRGVFVLLLNKIYKRSK
eukprot:CAMPEP_0119007456 /NCGR_PEP_ID=MMETSP1176-20130426/3022_1 /TAXON_ID=265551 /ORGANISM="Synedropsis recta cf, Strain CCMP1620" /LENGTH=430 /DNA_ID=CAMNT_0006959613 /DNA_START=13 /DNA_END=1305 /DNA_ORIENTATION=-